MREIDWTSVGEEAAELLRRLIAIRSVNPPGGEAEAADLLAAEIRARGLEPRVFASAPGRANLVARLAGDGSKRPVLLYQHTDVVEAGEGWSCDPFAGETRDGFVWGRGAIDMKGMGVMEILAVDLLRREFPDPAQRCRDIVLFAAADEEGGGGAGTRWMLENHADQIDAEFVWDEGGFGVRDLFGPFPVFTVSVAEKKALWVRLVARGEPGHGGIPRGENSADILAAALVRLARSKRAGWLGRAELHPVVREMFRGVGKAMAFPRSLILRNLHNPIVFRLALSLLSANPTISAMLRDTVSVTSLRAGAKENVIPERAEAVLDIRLLPRHDPALFIERLRGVIGDDRIAVEIIQPPEDASVSPYGSEFFLSLSEVIGGVVPGSVVAPMMTPGTTDSCFFRRRGISAYGLFPALIDPGELSRFHGIDERISVANLALGTRIIYEVLKRMCVRDAAY